MRYANKSRGKIGSFLKTGVIGDTTQALGAGYLASVITNRVAPQFSMYTSLGAEYLAGGLTGMALAEGIKYVAGGPSIISGLTGSLSNITGSIGGSGSSGEFV